MRKRNLIFLLLSLTSLTFAETKLRMSAFFGRHFYGQQVRAADWELEKLGDGFGMMGFGAHAQLSNVLANVGAFNTTQGLAYDAQLGFKLYGVSAYYGKFNALDSDISNDLLTPQYVGIGKHWNFGRTSLRLDVQYGFGSMTLSQTLPPGYFYDDIDIDFSMFSFTPQVSYRILQHFYAYAALGLANYSFSDNTDITLNGGLMVGDLFYRFLSAPRAILRYIPDPTLIRKPNIYLYPETPTHVTVQLFPQDRLTASIPEYGNGWEVMAWPDGRISGTPGFLFYEAEISLYAPRNGWCVKTENMRSFFEHLLPAYGLNDREITDFLDYWLAELQAPPFYTISPLVNTKVDDLCPMFISPVPDQILRLWFIFQPRDSFVEKTPPLVPAFERNGFVVMEWGGAILE